MCELFQDLVYFGLQSSYASFAMQNSHFKLKLNFLTVLCTGKSWYVCSFSVAQAVKSLSSSNKAGLDSVNHKRC